MGYVKVIDEAIVEHRRQSQAEADARPDALWRRLRAERWGPAVGSPVPGIIIDKPDAGHLARAYKQAYGKQDQEGGQG